jgi:hypothetical protein
MDFLEFYTESLDEEFGTGAGGFLSKIATGGGGGSKTKTSTPIGNPKSTGEIPKDYGYRKHTENAQKIKELTASMKKMTDDHARELKAKENEIIEQLRQYQNTDPDPQQQQQIPNQQNISNDDEINKLKEELAKVHNERNMYIQDLEEYNKSLENYDGLQQYMKMMENDFARNREELYSKIGDLKSILDIAENGIKEFNDDASKVYKHLSSDNEAQMKNFASQHKARFELINSELAYYKKTIKDLSDEYEQKKLEIEKQKQDAQQEQPTNVEPEVDGFQADEPETVVVNDTDRIRNIIKNKKSSTSDDELRNMINKVKELNPELANLGVSDEEILQMVKDQKEKEQGNTATESISFSEFYALNELGGSVVKALGADSSSPYLLNRLAGRGVEALKNKSATKKAMAKNKTVNELPQGMTANTFFMVSYAGYTATNTTCSKSITEYQKMVKDHGAGKAKKFARDFCMIVQRDNLEIEGDIKPELDFFRFPPEVKNMSLMKGTIWRTSNLGVVFTMVGQINADEDSTQDDNDNMRYFVGCDVKGSKFFMDNYHMSLKQYLQHVRNATATTMAQDAETMTGAIGSATGDQNSGVEIPIYAKKFTDRAKADIVKAKIIEYRDANRINIASEDPINTPDAQGFKVTFRNGQNITNITNDMGEYVVNASEGLLDDIKNKIDPEGISQYRRV